MFLTLFFPLGFTSIQSDCTSHLFLVSSEQASRLIGVSVSQLSVQFSGWDMLTSFRFFSRGQ